jgi:hypothetical protein
MQEAQVATFEAYICRATDVRHVAFWVRAGKKDGDLVSAEEFRSLDGGRFQSFDPILCGECGANLLPRAECIDRRQTRDFP